MEKIFSAKTEEDAKAEAVREFASLGVSEGDIAFEILERPVRKLFGGTKGDFKIKASAEIPAALYAEERPQPTLKAAVEPEEEPRPVSVPEAPADDAAVPADSADLLESKKVKSAVQYLTKVLTALGVENFRIDTVLNGETVFLDIVGEKLGVVIGRRGETLDALQYLTILASNKTEESYCRISVDCNGYRSKRKETLEQLAEKTAYRVLKQGRRITLEPMNPYERRIIHSKVAEIDGVYSSSVGDEPFRKVVISANAKPAYSSSSRSGDRSERRGRQGRPSTAGRSYRQSAGFSTSFEREYKRTQSEPTTYSQETVDTEKNASLYGKIEL